MPQPTLLLIAHGSRSDSWNQEIRTFSRQMQQALTEFPQFTDVAHCFLEYARPSIPEAIRSLAEAKNLEIAALPLFLSISEHVIHDIPREIGSVASLVESREDQSVYRCEGSRITLLQPPPTVELLADNLTRRYRDLAEGLHNPSILLVFYGSKRYQSAWNRLGRETSDALAGQVAVSVIQWEYGGDAVDFSPEPIAQKIQEMVAGSDGMVILPVLVSVGVIQTEVIPHAIQMSGCSERVRYGGDAILPDSDLARKVLIYAVGTFWQYQGEYYL